MATALQSIKMYLAYETAHVQAVGDSRDVIKAEIDALQELIRKAKIELELSKETAIDLGFAELKEVWTEEHVVKGHFKRRFTWHKA